MQQHRPKALSRRVLRRAWVVIVCLGIAGAISAQANTTRTVYWSSSTTLLVPSEIGQAYDARQQAATYAALLPLDDGVAAAVANKLGISPGQVRGGLSVTNVLNTSLVVITFRAATPQLAARGLREYSAAVSGPNPASPAIQPNTLAVFNAPTPPSRSTTGVPVLPIGLILGAIAGVAVAVILDRIDPRADSAEIVERVVGAPVTDIAAASRESLAALAERWHTLAGRGGSVALVGTDERSVPAALAAARAIAASTSVAGRPGFRVAVNLPPRDRDIELTAARYRAAAILADVTNDSAGIVLVPAQGTWREDGELTAVGADVVVLVVRAGRPLRDAEDAVRTLTMLGRPPSWCLLVPQSMGPLLSRTSTDDIRSNALAEERSRAT